MLNQAVRPSLSNARAVIMTVKSGNSASARIIFLSARGQALHPRQQAAFARRGLSDTISLSSTMAYKSYFVTQADSPWLIMDRTNLVGIVVSGGAWGDCIVQARASRSFRLSDFAGVLLSLSFLTAQALVACRSSTSKATRAHALPLLVYVAFVFSCGTVNYGMYDLSSGPISFANVFTQPRI